MELVKADTQLIRFLRSHKTLALQYKNLPETENEIQFWVSEMLNSDCFSLSEKRELFECVIYSRHDGMRFADEKDQDFIHWGYSHLVGVPLYSLCRLFPINNLAAAEEALKNPNWEMDKYFSIINNALYLEGDSMRESKKAVIFFFDNLPTAMLTKQNIVSMLDYIASSQRLTPPYLTDKQGYLSALSATLKEIIIRRVGGNLPYSWAVELLTDDINFLTHQS